MPENKEKEKGKNCQRFVFFGSSNKTLFFNKKAGQDRNRLKNGSGPSGSLSRQEKQL